MIPHDDFTPHGYLDNPYHRWKINPSGVLRSLEPLGMGWHVPNLCSYKITITLVKSRATAIAEALARSASCATLITEQCFRVSRWG